MAMDGALRLIAMDGALRLMARRETGTRGKLTGILDNGIR